MAIELTRLPPVAQDAKHCMSWGAIEGNRTHPFAWGSTGYHGLVCNRWQFNSPIHHITPHWSEWYTSGSICDSDLSVHVSHSDTSMLLIPVEVSAKVTCLVHDSHSLQPQKYLPC